MGTSPSPFSQYHKTITAYLRMVVYVYVRDITSPRVDRAHPLFAYFPRPFTLSSLLAAVSSVPSVPALGYLFFPSLFMEASYTGH